MKGSLSNTPCHATTALEEFGVTYTLFRLNLAVVRNQLKSRLKWSKRRLEKTEKAYRKFWADILNGAGSSSCPVPPSDDVDTFWHQHILNTAKYSRDCDNYFGFFLHHQPK